MARPELTGLDLLILTAVQGYKEARDPNIDDEVAEAFSSLLTAAARANPAATTEMLEIATRPASLSEQTAAHVIALAMSTAMDRGDALAMREVLVDGVRLAMRFEEFVDAMPAR